MLAKTFYGRPHPPLTDIRIRRRLKRLAHTIAAALDAHPGDAKSCVVLGRIEERLGLLEKAEERLRAAARLLPGSPDVQLLLCENLMRQGRKRQALERCREALRLAPDRPGIHLIMGEVLSRLGRDEDAEGHFRQALTLDPSGLEAYIKCSECLLRQGQASEAVALLNKAVAIAPASDTVRFLLRSAMLAEAKNAAIGRGAVDSEGRLIQAISFWKSGRMRRARTAFQDVIAAAPESIRARLAYAEFCLDSNRDRESYAHLRRALRAAGKNVRDLGSEASARALLVRLAQASRERGQDRKAELLFRRVASTDAGLDGQMPLIEFLKDEGRYEEAVRCLRAAAKISSQDAAIDFHLGWVYGKQRKFALMRGNFERYARRATTGEDPFRRYCALVVLGDYQRAFQAGEEAIARPSSDLILEKLALPWPESWLKPYGRGFYERQLSMLESWERGRRKSSWAAFLKVCIWSRLSGWDKLPAEIGTRQLRSLEDLERLVSPSEKRYGWMLYFAGLGRLQLSSYESAREHFEAAARSRPRFWLARGRLAESLLCLGRQDEAFAVFSRMEEDIPEARPHALAWHGEALLWTGRWRRALTRLDRAIETDSWLAVCWRGAANILGGRYEAALRDLDRAIVPGSQDAEAFLWRGELLRRMGRLREAKTDLDEAIRLGGKRWGLWNRALLHAQSGDMRAMHADLGSADAEMVEHVSRRLGLGGKAPRSDLEAVRLLETGLKLAKGVRRHEPYLRGIWMR